MIHSFSKALFGVAVFTFLLPFAVSADTSVSGGVSVGGPGWGVSVGGSTGGFGGAGGMGGGFIGGGVGQMLSNASSFGLPGSSIYVIIGNTVFWLLAILGFIGVLAFVVAGIMYLVAAGDDDLIDRAKEALKWSLVGVIVALLGLIIMQSVTVWLSGGTFF